METVEEIIRRHPFWNGLDTEYFHPFEVHATLEKFGLGQPIFTEGGNADYFYLVHQGRVSLEMFVRGKGLVTIESLASGETLGWSWLFPPYRWQFAARSHAETELVAVPAAALRDYAKSNHDFGYELAMRVGKVTLMRLQATRLQLLDFYGAIGD